MTKVALILLVGQSQTSPLETSLLVSIFDTKDPYDRPLTDHYRSIY